MLKQKNFLGGIMPSKKTGAVIGAASAIVLMAIATTPAAAADAAHGKVVFQTCAACHTDKPDAIGPSLRGVYGRKSAALPDFRYSNAMTRANLTWDDANLKAYIKDPAGQGERQPHAVRRAKQRCGHRRRHRLSEGLQIVGAHRRTLATRRPHAGSLL